ncbi:MAG: 2-C-methyl-D-erythritol 2,4-cyclodiphosphate synthase [Candidatus Omnitrophica bacterium]|nr:2-C-methyl-D-erythritol 2,4-cyclodiphosphate synthase [Candidatus Omnitrophota bacterium]
MYRTGIGYDIHKLVNGRKLFLGGVEIPFSKGLLGHSDADVLLHAVCDALLGACGLGDIGVHFPDTDPELKDISSKELLRKTRAIIDAKGPVNVLNIDTVIVCDEPKLAEYIDGMENAIADTLGILPDVVNVKATTTEGTAPDIISSYATALIEVKGDLR